MNSKSFRGMTAGAVLVFFLLTCENSGLGNVGLGKVVDTTAPTASVVEPLPSSFIKGDQLFKIKAEDDVGLAKNNPVAIAFVNDLIAYETAIKNGDSTAQDPWIPAFYNEADKLYHVSIDTRAITNSIDGQYSFRIKARDDSGHPPFESSDLVYSVKNGPPMVEMLIPKLDWANIETDPAQAPEVLNSGFLSGVASDLQGVAAGYPLIKLWKDNETEPAEWKVPPVPESNEGGKSFAFRYYTSNDGNVTSDAKEYLTNGLYHVKFQIRDVNGLEVNYPETGSVLINITAAAESPKVTITKLDNQQQNKAFTIRAEVTHSVGVAMGQEGVFEQSATNLTFTKNEIKYGVPWASITSDETQGDRKVVFESYPITPSLSAQALDGAIVIVGEDFTFPDDTYDFDVEAVSIRADRATATYANVTIDTGAPAIEVTNIAPTCTKSDDADNEYVNGKITVDFTATDDNGLGVEADGKRHLKYLVTQTRRTRQTDLDDGLLYDEGEWVDGNPSNGPVVVNSAKRLTVDTTQALYTDGEPLYIYLIAKDKAGNVYSVEKVVNIEQATDEPLFAFTNEQISEFAEFAERGETPYQTTSVMSSANARISGTIEDDDALHVNVEEVEGVEVGGLKLSIWQEEKGKNPAATEKYIFRKGLTGNKSVKFDISLADMSGARNGVGDPLGGGTDSLPEGGYYFTLEMGDLASAKNGLAAVTKETAVYYIAVDMKDPEINVTSPTDNAFVDPTASLTLEGNVVEANIETNVGTNDFILRVSKPHGVGATPGAGDYTKVTPQGDGNWTLTFDEGAVDETNRQITLQAKDRFGKTTEKLLTVRVDGEAPVVDSIKFPVENVGDAVSVVSSTELSINGTAADGPTGSASGVEQVFYQITDSETAPPLPTDYNALGGWKLSNGMTQWSAVESLSSVQQGSKYLHVFARDVAHNTGAIKSTRFEFDTADPEIRDVVWGNTVQVGVTHYVNGGFTLKFDAFDSNALKDVSITRKSDGTSDNIVPILVKNGTNQWNVTLTEKAGTGDGELNSGSYEYTLLVKDAADKTTTQTFTVAVDITAPVVDSIKFPVENVGDAVSVVSSTELSINGTAADGPTGSASGVEQVFYQITDSAAAPSQPTDYNALGGWKLSNGMTQWSAIESLSSVQQGSKYLHVFARDVAHNTGAIKSTRFEFDTADPEIRDVVWGNTVQVGVTHYVNGGFTLKFDAFDSNALKDVSITRKSGGTSDNIVPTLVKNGTNQWNVTLTEKVGTGDGELGGGSYEYTLLVRDAADKTTTQTFTVAVDTTAPVVDLKFPVENVGDAMSVVMNAELSINGTAADGPTGSASGVEQVFYQITDSAAAPPLPTDYNALGGWKLSNGMSQWSATELLSSTQQGSQYLHVFARDVVHNAGAIKSTRFEVDTENPEIGDAVWGNTIQVGATRYVNGGFTLKFSVFDSNALHNGAPISLTRKIVGGTSVDVKPSIEKTGYYKGDFSDQKYGSYGNFNEKNLWGVTLTEKVGTGDGELGSGSYEYTLLVKDVANKTATQTFTIAVDITPPEIEVTGVTPTVAEAGGTYTVNGIARVNFNASDNEGIGEENYGNSSKRQIKYLLSTEKNLTDAETIYKESDAVLVDNFPNYDDGKSGSVMVKQSESKSLYINTQKLTDKAEAYLYIAVQDRAGNFGYSKTTLYVDQSTDKPSIVFTDIDTTIKTVSDLLGKGSANVLGSDAKIRGTFTDDDAIDVTTTKPKLVIWKENEENDKKSLDLTGLTGTGTVSFSLNRQTLGGAFNAVDLAEGVYFFTLEVSDATSGDFAVTSVQTTIGEICFAVDTDNPKITVTTPTRGSYQSETFTLSGTIADNSNKATGLPPVLTIKDPDDASASSFTFTYYDAATGEWAWTYAVTGISDMEKTVRIVAKDRFGKETTDDFTVEFDKTAPIVTIKQPVINKWFEGVTMAFNGSLSDDSGKGLQKVYYFIMKPGVMAVPTAPASPLDTTKVDVQWQEANITGNTWSIMADLSDDAVAVEGTNVLYVIGYDAAGNGPDKDTANWNSGAPVWSNSWASNVPSKNTAASTLTFMVDRAAPVADLKFYKASDSTYTTALADKDYIDEGFSLYGTVTDSNELATLVVKQNDAEVPLTASELTQTNSKSWSVNLAGLPRAPNNLSTTLANPEGVYVYTIEVADKSVGLLHNVTLKQTLTVDTSGPAVTIMSPAEGEPFNSASITVTGAADDGTAGAGVSKVYFRIGGPATNYTVPNGTEVDGDPNNIKNWVLANGTTQWSKTGVAIGSIEGSLKFTAFAEDDLGNKGAASVHNFYVDASNPEILDDDYVAISAEKYTNGAFTLKFTAFDSNILNTEATDAGGKLAGVVITRTSGGTPTEVFNAYTVSDGFKSISENAYTDSYGNKLTIKGTYTGVLDGRLSIKDYSLEKVWGVTLNQNDLASGLLADGIYDYTITVTDAGGRTASKTVTITVDAAAPSLDVTRFTALVNRDVGGGDGLLDYVNGVIQFAVSASDENGLAVANPLQYWILPASAATPAPTATNWTSAGGTFFGRSDQPLINTESGSDNQSTPATFDQTGTKAASTYKLHIGAMDKAGNIGLTTYNTDAHADYSFVINQETDKPFVSITSPGADAYVGSSHLVQGVLTDDDGFKASASDNDRIEIHYTTDGGSNWQPVKGTITTTKITDFEYNFTYSVADIGNTPIWVQVTAKDDASKKLVIGGSNAPQVTAVETVNFTIDSTPPALSVATAEDTFNKNFSLTGSFVERNYRTGTLQVGINGGGKTALTPTQDVNFATNSTWNWTYNVDLNALQDGVNTIEFEVYDAREQVGRKSVVVNKDTTAPTVTVSEFKNFVTVTNAGNTVNYVNGVVKFAVLASDNIGTKETRYWLLPKTSDASAESARVIGLGSAMGALGYDTSKAVDAATNNPANGTVFTGTEVTLDTASDVDNQQSPVAIVDKTEYTLYVGVSDKAGNAFVYTYLPNAAVNYSFHVDQSTDAPVLTFDNLSVGEENFIAGGVLSGSITDDDGFAQAESLVIAFAPDNNGTPDDWSILTGFTPARTMIGTREIKWSTALPTDIATDGAYHIRVNVTDDGTKKVGAEGDKLFTGTPVQFTLDTTPPIPAITTLGVADGTLAASVSSAPAIKGTLVETNPLSLTVTVKDGVGATVAEGLFNQGMLSTSDWAWNWAPSTGAGAFVDLPDGPYTVVVETIDRVNTQAHSGSVQSVFNKDTAAPSIAFSNLSKEMILTRELMLEVADESDGYTGWTGHGLSGSPTNAEIHTKALTVYKETKAAMTDIIRNTDTNLRGTFTDEYSGVTKFDYRFDTDPYDDTAIDDANKTMWRSGSGKLGTPNAKTSSWIIPIPAANETAGSAPYTDSSTYPVKDGIRRVTIRVYDALGNAGAKTDIAFYLDREAPVFDLTQFGGGASGNDAASLIYSVGGLANDMDVVFTLKGGVRDANIKTLSVSGVGGVTPVLSGETESGKEFTYTVTKSAFTALAEGLHTITLNAVDIADNNAQTTWTFVKDTTPPENTFLNMSGLASNTASNPFLFGDGSAKVMGSTLDATSGLKSLTYTLQAKNGVDWSNPVDKSVDQPLTATPTWNIVLGGGGLSLNDGQYRIKVMAEDNAKRTGGTDNPNTTVNGTGLSEWIYFVLDTINPILSVESTKQYYNGDIPLKGNATDDNGIASVEVSFSSFPTESKKSLTTDASGNWAVIMPIADSAYTLTQGKQTINITAYDNAGHATTVQKEFTLDTTPPDGVVVKQPNASGARVTGKLTVSGVANDNNSVSKIFYQIGKPDLTETSTIAAGKAYTIQTLGTVSEWTAVGAPLNAQVGTAFIADKGGTVSGTARAWKDTLLDSATAATDTTPTTITWSGGVWAWNVAFAELKYFVNASGAAAYDGTGGTYGVQRYRYTSATDDQLITYANDNSNLTQTAPENNVWDVPINVLVFDSAGNATACDFYITVDPHMDKATSEILTPDGKQAVGGTVRLTGTASDNNIVNSVWVRVSGAAHTDTEVWVDPHDHTKGYTNWSFSEWTESGANGSADKWYDWDTNWSSSVAANTTYAGSDSSLGVGWHAASLQGPGSGMVNWYINLNANGKLNPPSGTNERTVYIEVFARDTKNDNDYTSLVNSVNGYITRSILTFSSNVPIIENITVTPQGGSAENYTYQMQISQTVTIEADVKDSDGISAITVQATGGTPIPVKDKTDETIGNLKVTAKVADDKTITSGETIKAGMRYYVADETSFSYAGWSTGTKIFTAGSTDSASPGGVLYEEDVNGFFVYHVEMTIDSASLFPEGTGTYGLALSTTDDSASSLSASQAMSFQIDNYFPRAVYTASTTAVGDYTLRGTVNDAPTSGSIQGLKSVTVYFSRDAVYYMPSATKSSGMMVHMVSTDSSAQTTVKARKWDGTNLAVPADVVYPKSGYGIVIDVDESASGEKDGDNFVEYWYDNAGSEKTWGATFDSTVITDGKITVHYLAEDRAGNKTYAEQEVYFQNHAPSITSLTLGTPLIGSTITAEGQKSINDRYLDNVFTVRNSLFQIKLNVSGGNGDKHYRMSYLTRSAGPISSIMKDKIYTVASTNAGFDFKTIGAEDSIVGAPFVATRNETTLNGATVFEYTPTALVKTDAGGIGNGAAVSAAVDFTSSAFGSGADLIADSADYAVVRVGGTLTAGQKYRIEELGDTAWSSLVGIANAEKGSTFIPLTNTTMTGSGAAVTSNDRYFFVKVWDSTMAGAGETEQLSDFVLLAVRVENEDKRPPVTQLYDLNPKAETTLAASVSPVVMVGSATTVQNTTKGSLYLAGGKISGHIEPRDGKGDGTTIDTAKANIWLEHELDENGDEKNPIVIKPSGFVKDTASGIVVLRGQAQDDQRITALYLDFEGAKRKILEADTDGRLKRSGALTTDDVGVYQTLGLDGHYVEWTYRWNTELMSGDITVTARAEDKSAGAANQGAAGGGGVSPDRGNAADNTEYNSIGLSLAPYITTLTRFKNSAGMTEADKAPALRSRNGWFSFRRGVGDVERMQIEGFNLAGSVTSVKIDGVDGGTLMQNLLQNGTYYIDVPSAVTSGYVTYTADGVEAVNNRNNNANSWNTSQEALVGNESSALWNDDRAVHLFDSHNIEAGANQGHFRNPTVVGSIVKPAMTIDPSTGRLWASWSSYMINNTAVNHANGGGAGSTRMPMYFSHNSDGDNGATLPNNARPVSWSMDPSEDTDISWNTTDNRRSIVYLANYMTSGYGDGGLCFWDTGDGVQDMKTGTPVERFDNAGNSQLLQFINPRIVNDGNVSHIAYYDDKYHVLRYWNTNKSGALRGWEAPGVVVDGVRPASLLQTFENNDEFSEWRGTNYQNKPATATFYKYGDDNSYVTKGVKTPTDTRTRIGGLYNNSSYIAYMFAKADGILTSLSNGVTVSLTDPVTAITPPPDPTAPDAGNYSAIDVNSAGIPVIAYLVQDKAAGTEKLKYAYGNAADATTFTTADIATIGISTAGRYVSMRIDKDTAAGRLNVMHIVFMDSDNGDLVYIKGTPSGTSGAYTFGAPVVIDSVGNVGKWADIAIDATGNPVVSYLDQGGIDSRTGFKMAFLDSAVFGGNGWEYVTLPGRYVVNDVRTQVECDSRIARVWDAAFAYVSDDYYRISYYVK